jgi:hypothetical protein
MRYETIVGPPIALMAALAGANKRLATAHLIDINWRDGVLLEAETDSETTPLSRRSLARYVAPWAVGFQESFPDFEIETVCMTFADAAQSGGSHDIGTACAALERGILDEIPAGLPCGIRLRAGPGSRRGFGAIFHMALNEHRNFGDDLSNGVAIATHWFQSLGPWARGINTIVMDMKAQKLSAHEKLALTRDRRRQMAL